MAGKRITTVDEMANPDEGADFLLVVRGTQRDLRRLRIGNLPGGGFDLHDDVATEVTTLADIDRLLLSDEGTPGAPNGWIRLSTLRSFLSNAFDLHDDVPTELDSLADADRILVSDEDQSGDPQKYATLETLKEWVLGDALRVEKLSTEMTLYPNNLTVSHSLGRVPLGFQLRLICKTAQYGYSAGDEAYPVFSEILNSGGYADTGITIYSVTDSNLKITAGNQGSAQLLVNTKDGTYRHRLLQNNQNWRLGLTIWG